jgi:hypothetical protein
MAQLLGGNMSERKKKIYEGMKKAFNTPDGRKKKKKEKSWYESVADTIKSNIQDRQDKFKAGHKKKKK